MRTKGFSSAAQDRRLPGANACFAGAFLGTHFAVRAVDFVAGFGGGGAEARVVAFVDDGAVEDVAAEGEVEVRGGVGFEAEGLHGGEFVDGC